ncbi:MAG: WD40 repeat domain-containing protein [Treponema sp.]|jgi:hypothetical protein|nr:WD40 repeat domain-containing protein [Treponema sp.]
MKRKTPRLIPLFAALFATAGGLFAQGGDGLWVFADTVPGSHQGKVNSLQYDGQQFLSAGEDGFLERWDGDQALLRFQISGLPITATALRPGKSQIACIETDDMGQYRISVWDYKTLKNLFTLRFRDPVQSVSYSAGGTYLIVCRSGTTGLVLVNSDTGELLLDPRNIPDDFPSTVGLAAIGRTERVMLTYSPSGILSYWELKTDGELRLAPSYDSSFRPLNFDVPPNLSSPVLFGNNRFLAGIDRGGLVILRADTGAELARDSAVSQGKLSGLGAELYCLVTGASGGDNRGEAIFRFRMNNTDRVERREFFSIPAFMSVSTLLPFSTETGALPQIVFGTTGGELLTADPRFSLYIAKKLTTRAQTPIPEIAVGTEHIAFLAGERMGYIPLDFLELKNGETIRLEPSGAYTRITAAGLPGTPPGTPSPSSPLPPSSPVPAPPGAGDPLTEDPPAAEPSPAREGEDRFLFWQDESPLPVPVFRAPGREDTTLPGPETRSSGSRFPLRSVSMMEDRSLFLDTRGTISVLSLTDGEEIYTESFIGAMDAAFIDRDNVVLGRSAPFSLGITAPFLKVDIKTGETVPISYPASAGIQVYRGSSGTVYGITVEGTENGLRTSIIRLDTQGSTSLVEYNGEDTRVSVAEADGFLASNIGGGEAGIYTPWGQIPVERGPGLPRSIGNGDLYFIVLDTEGCVSWHDPRTGNILAVFRLYENRWTLGTAWGRPIWGWVIP